MACSNTTPEGELAQSRHLADLHRHQVAGGDRVKGNRISDFGWAAASPVSSKVGVTFNEGPLGGP